jgi:hypothetical protein
MKCVRETVGERERERGELEFYRIEKTEKIGRRS